MKNKQDIDKHFTNLYPMLEKITKGLIFKYKKHRQDYDYTTVISLAYFYLLENTDKFETQDEMQRLIINWINKSIMWKNSKLNREFSEKVYKQKHSDEPDENHILPIVRTTIEDHNFESFKETIDDSDECIEDKIYLENWINERKSCLSSYYNQLQTLEDKIIFETYFIRNITKGIDVAKELGINENRASIFLRKMKQDIKDYYQNNFNNNN